METGLVITRCETREYTDNSFNDSNILWVQRKPTERDIAATERLLDLRLEYSKYFNDKKTTKQSLWQTIAERLSSEGFNFNVSKTQAGEKCRQKFANLQKTYMNYISHCKQTGNERKEPPQYYSKLHSIFGDKHKVFPVAIHDSLGINEPQLLGSNEMETDPTSNASGMNEVSSDEENTPNKYSTTKKILRPNRDDKFIEAVRDLNKETIKAITDSNEKTNKLLAEQNRLIECQNQQREKLINAFIKMVDMSTSNK